MQLIGEELDFETGLPTKLKFGHLIMPKLVAPVPEPADDPSHGGTYYHCTFCKGWHPKSAEMPAKEQEEADASEASEKVTRKAALDDKKLQEAALRGPGAILSIVNDPPNYVPPTWVKTPDPATGIKPDLQLTLEAANFYIRLDMALDPLYPYAGEMMRQAELQACELAPQFARYLELACLGEARYYLGGHAKGASYLSKGLTKFLADFRKIAKSKSGETNDRGSVWGHADPFLAKYGRQAILYLVYIFCKGSWTGSFGGPKWGNCAKLLLEYRRKRLSDLVFVDQAFGLQHNGSIVYDKMTWKIENLLPVLNWNQRGHMQEVSNYARFELMDSWRMWQKVRRALMIPAKPWQPRLRDSYGRFTKA